MRRDGWMPLLFSALVCVAVVLGAGALVERRSGRIGLPPQPESERQASEARQHHAEPQPQVRPGVPFPPRQANGDGNAAPGQKQADQDGPEATDVAQAVAAVAGVAIALAVAYFTARQLQVSREQKAIAARQLIIDKRPRLSVRSVLLHSEITPRWPPLHLFAGDKRAEGHFEAVNTGGTPATIVRVRCEVWWRNTSLQMRPPPCGGDNLPGVAALKLTAGQAAEIGFTSDREIGDAGMCVRLGWDDYRLWVVGWIDYDDDLGTRRRTRFCRRWNHETGGFVRETDPDYETED